MTQTEISPAEVLQGQLLDVLVSIDLDVLASLDRRTFFAVNDWVDLVKEAAPRMLKFPPPPAVIKSYLTTEQLAGEWTAFTTWRPVTPRRGLFD